VPNWPTCPAAVREFPQACHCKFGRHDAGDDFFVRFLSSKRNNGVGAIERSGSIFSYCSHASFLCGSRRLEDMRPYEETISVRLRRRQGKVCLSLRDGDVVDWVRGRGDFNGQPDADNSPTRPSIVCRGLLTLSTLGAFSGS